MEAGRELDALIYMILHDIHPRELMLCRYVDGDVQPHVGYPVGHVSPPHYSTQIADAWLIVDKMSTTTKEFWTLKYFSTGAIAIFDYEGGRDLPWIIGEHEGDAEEMPEAICLAALKAVGVEV